MGRDHAIAGAVIAPGTIVVEIERKKVQHPTGGVVGDILVREGAEVEAGEVVVRLDDTVTSSTLGVVRSQLDELMAREARLLAERDDAAAIVFPKQLTSARGGIGDDGVPARKSCLNRGATHATASGRNCASGSRRPTRRFAG